MDNVCHTLAGLAMAEAGLKRRTPFGTVTLIVASNLPDVDVLVFATDLPSVAFRRGWTHGVLAQALLPIALAALVSWSSRFRSAGVRPDFRGVLLLSYIGVLTHVYLDLLNNYGVRLLMPFSTRWFYGDSAFIVDFWLWIMLGVGVWLTWNRPTQRPAQVAVLLAAVYIGALIVSARVARGVVLDAWRTRQGTAPRSLMVGPVPLTPFRRAIIVDAGDAYVTGRFTWFPADVRFDERTVPKNDDHPVVRRAIVQDPRLRAVLSWSRFPSYRIESTAAGVVVTFRDLRFGDRVGAVRAVVAASPGSSYRTDP